jgi:hypothetical protein
LSADTDIPGYAALPAVVSADPEDLREVIGAYHKCAAGTASREVRAVEPMRSQNHHRELAAFGAVGRIGACGERDTRARMANMREGHYDGGFGGAR